MNKSPQDYYFIDFEGLFGIPGVYGFALKTFFDKYKVIDPYSLQYVKYLRP